MGLFGSAANMNAQPQMNQQQQLSAMADMVQQQPLFGASMGQEAQYGAYKPDGGLFGQQQYQ